MIRKHILEAIVVVIIVGVLAAMLLPSLKRSGSPAWDGEAYGFLTNVRSALRDYAGKHHGNAPQSLAALYPDYTKDKRVRDPIIDCGSMRLGVVYYRPQKLGSPKTAVMELLVDPSAETRHDYRRWVLWGDLRTELR